MEPKAIKVLVLTFPKKQLPISPMWARGSRMVIELAYRMEVSVLGHRTGTEKITMTERRWRMSKQERQIIRLIYNISIQHNN